MAGFRGKTIQRKIWAVGCTSAQNCWRRSANRNNANNAWNVNTSGNVNTNNAVNANRCAPSVLVTALRWPTHSAGAEQKQTYTEPNALPDRRNNTATMQPAFGPCAI